MAAHHVADFADDAVAIGGDYLDEHAHAARTVALEIHLFVLLAFQLPGAPRNCAFDVVAGHILVLGG